MTPQDFDYLRKLLRERSGLVLSAEKQYLAESRLLPVARKHGMTTLAELVGKLKANAAPLAAEVVDAMTTNETFFFRDKLPFEHFRDTVLPALIAARAREKRLRVWCTAASSGQEPYSLAMTLKGLGAGARRLPRRDPRHRLVRRSAGEGESRHLQPVRGAARPADREPGEILHPGRRELADRARNPRHGAVPPAQSAQRFLPLGTFDVVFCRNVLIYFDQDTKIGVLNRLARQMAGDGFLLLGAAETVVGLTDAFKPMSDKRGLYAPNAERSAARPAPVLKFAAKG